MADTAVTMWGMGRASSSTHHSPGATTPILGELPLDELPLDVTNGWGTNGWATQPTKPLGKTLFAELRWKVNAASQVPSAQLNGGSRGGGRVCRWGGEREGGWLGRMRMRWMRRWTRRSEKWLLHPKCPLHNWSIWGVGNFRCKKVGWRCNYHIAPHHTSPTLTRMIIVIVIVIVIVILPPPHLTNSHPDDHRHIIVSEVMNIPMKG